MPLSHGPSAPASHPKKEKFWGAVGAMFLALGGMIQEANAQAPAAKTIPVQQIELDTQEKISYLELGDLEDGKPVVFIHGITGSGKAYACINDLLKEHGIHGLAPNLFGPHTDWNEMDSVAEVGICLAKLSDHVFKGKTKPDIVGTSAGGKEAAALCAELNRKYGPGAVENLLLVCAQSDLDVNGEPFQFLNSDPERQWKLKAVWGIARQARGPLRQILPNIIARLKRRGAKNQIEAMAGTDDIFMQNLFAYMSPTDLAVLEADPAFEEALRSDAIARTKWEIIKEVERLRNWNIDFGDIRGTNVEIYQGEGDLVVDPRNANDWYKKLTREGVHARVNMRPGGHLLLKDEAKEIARKVGKK